jgi:hypothetical protein
MNQGPTGYFTSVNEAQKFSFMTIVEYGFPKTAILYARETGALKIQK